MQVHKSRLPIQFEFKRNFYDESVDFFVKLFSVEISTYVHYENKVTKLVYSKALRYTALRSADLGDTRFLIGSQNTWDTLFWAKSLEDARFLIGSQNTWDTLFC